MTFNARISHKMVVKNTIGKIKGSLGMATLKRALATVMAMLILLAPAHQAQAAMISNQQLSHQLDRQQITALFSRGDVQQQLMQLGVDPVQAQNRVAAMSDAEIRRLNQHLADQPAGEGFLSLAFTVFLVFVITDMLGATDVFPFVKNINH